LSKSLGNTIDPFSVVKEYGTDALRFYVCRELSPFEDSPFSIDLFKESYNAYLANGLGNLISRTMKMAETNNVKYEREIENQLEQSEEFLHIYRAYSESFANYNLQQAINACFEIVSNSDKLIQERQPFKKIKTDKEGGEKDIKELLARLNIIAKLLIPFMPETSNKIVELIKNNKMPATPIFIRK
jgi:methionyl-tRNA synthetase